MRPLARGTWGALCSLLPAVAAGPLSPAFLGGRLAFRCVLALLFTPPAIWAATRVAERVGRKDPNLVVVDEVVGQWVALAGATVLQLEERSGGVPAVPYVRHLEARAGAPTRETARRRRASSRTIVMAGIYAALVLCAAGCFNLY